MTHGFGQEARNYRHGHKPADGASPEYLAWLNMRARCYNPAHNRFHRYGGRGVTVCDAWRDSFEQFLADVGKRPSDEHSLDRHPDADGNYEPGNVRWATASAQANNRATNKIIEFRGKSLTLAQWEKDVGLPRGCLHARLKSGWPIAKALSTPAKA